MTVVDEDTVVVAFASDVTFNVARKGVKLEGENVENSNVSGSGKVVTITGMTAAQGQQIIIPSIMYAELFPSYSFTVMLLIP